MTTLEKYTHAHLRMIEDQDGQLVGLQEFCSDYCHRRHCEENGHEYAGWSGCHEIAAPAYCVHCGDSI